MKYSATNGQNGIGSGYDAAIYMIAKTQVFVDIMRPGAGTIMMGYVDVDDSDDATAMQSLANLAASNPGEFPGLAMADDEEYEKVVYWNEMVDAFDRITA